MRVSADAVDEARVTMLTLFPEGFEELEVADQFELAAYTGEGGAARMRDTFGLVSVTDVADGWEEAWRRFHRPVRVGPLWIGPPWERPPEEAFAVVVDPGRAFGTGGHETTRLCLQFLVELQRGSVLDLGCGSGVIAIAAAKLGFSPVWAIDSAPAAVEATHRNARENGVVVDVQQADVLAAELPEAHVTVANIEARIVRELGTRISSAFLVTSGYYHSEVVSPEGFRHVKRREEQRWAADLFERDRERARRRL